MADALQFANTLIKRIFNEKFNTHSTCFANFTIYKAQNVQFNKLNNKYCSSVCGKYVVLLRLSKSAPKPRFLAISNLIETVVLGCLLMVLVFHF